MHDAGGGSFVATGSEAPVDDQECETVHRRPGKECGSWQVDGAQALCVQCLDAVAEDARRGTSNSRDLCRRNDRARKHQSEEGRLTDGEVDVGTANGGEATSGVVDTGDAGFHALCEGYEAVHSDRTQQSLFVLEVAIGGRRVDAEFLGRGAQAESVGTPTPDKGGGNVDEGVGEIAVVIGRPHGGTRLLLCCS